MTEVAQHDRSSTRGPVPRLDARPGSRPERFARRLPTGDPVAVFVLALLAGFVLLAAVGIGLGVLVTQVLMPTSLGADDESVVHTLAAHRTGWETDLSAIGSTIGGAPVLPILVGVIAVVCAVLRWWRVAAFAVFVLVLESATYRVTSLVVPRDRPHVHRLDSLPADASFPSGHTAASVAVYAGLVLLATSRIRDRGWRAFAWIVAVGLPLFVAFSRMYRGMHHPLDVAAGALIGLGAIGVLLFACRAADAATHPRLARGGATDADRGGRIVRRGPAPAPAAADRSPAVTR
jgi:undecaprenyl-diphosphatase